MEMHPVGNNITNEGRPGRNESHESARPVILYIGPSLGFSDCLVRNLQYEFPDYGFVRFAGLPEMFDWAAVADDEIRLVIIDETLSGDLGSVLDDVARLFPSQIICVSLNHAVPPSNFDPGLLERNIVRSFLPMNLRLDIWLSAVRLMLNGGDYCPPEVMKSILAQDGANEDGRSAPRAASSRQSKKSGRLGRLTARELQVLTLVSQGFQNKNIAEELGLSEHTVKLHMHHIISKLGASNRTEAAGMFLDSLVSDSSAKPKLN
ncbi:MAG: response regulator transcription factor [Oricola sp.]